MRTLHKKTNNKKDALVSKKLSIIFLSLCILIYKIGLEKKPSFETRNIIYKVNKTKTTSKYMKQPD